MQERFKTFTVLISKISRSIRRIKTEEMDEFNLKSHHVSCLYYLYKAALSRSIEELEKNGYIECESNLKKRYRSALTLTEKGKTIGENIAKKIDKILQQASVGLSEEHRTILYDSLALINDNLDKLCKNYKGEK